VFQALQGASLTSSFTVALAPTVGVDYRLTRPLSIALEGSAPVSVLELSSGRVGFEFLPAVWLGVRVAL
jgi:hypothetical protein